MGTERLYRTLFISDVHLGTRASQADMLLDFLKHNDAETIYLVGDIIDFWRIKRGAVWPQTHNDVLQKLLPAEFLRDGLCDLGIGLGKMSREEGVEGGGVGRSSGAHERSLFSLFTGLTHPFSRWRLRG